MQINIGNLIYQLLPVVRRQSNRIAVLSSLIDLVKTNEQYAIWRAKYSRILRVNGQVIKLERYLRDVFCCEDIFIKEPTEGEIRVVLKEEKVNNELIFGLRSVEEERRQYLRLKLVSIDHSLADYTIVYPVKLNKELLIVELQRFNQPMKKYQFKELL